ncbi:MAG TPA: hypothetical protein PLP86_02750 [Armatimonadota bacterium]|nr:hypothetical protein [Armatimonadota bacterium]
MKTHFRKPAMIALAVVMALGIVLGTAFAAPRMGQAGQAGQQMKRQRQHQPADGQKMRAGRLGNKQMGAARIAAKLNLTPDQRQAIQSIVESHRQQAQRIMQSNLFPEEKRARRQELRQDMKREIFQILTPEQQAKAQRFMKQKAGQRQGAHLRMQQCFEQLNLTQEQKEQIAAIHRRAMVAVRDVKTNTELTDRAKQDRIKIIRERTHEQVMSVLTPEQRNQFNQFCAQHRQQKTQKMGGVRRLVR